MAFKKSSVKQVDHFRYSSHVNQKHIGKETTAVYLTQGVQNDGSKISS